MFFKIKYVKIQLGLFELVYLARIKIGWTHLAYWDHIFWVTHWYKVFSVI